MTTAATTVLLEVVSATGTAWWRDTRALQATPPSSFGDWTAPVPITVDHRPPVVGHIFYLEHGLGHGNGGLFGVGVVEGLSAESIDGQLQASAEIRCDALATTLESVEWEPHGTTWRMKPTATTVGRLTANQSVLDGVALVARTASVTSTRCRAWNGSYLDHIHRGRWAGPRGLPDIINRAVKAGTSELRYRSCAALRIHHPEREGHGDDYRHAGRPEVSHHAGGYVIDVR